MSQKSTIFLFVYGTLMQDQRNHHFLEGATFVDDVITVDSYTMFSHESFPAVILTPQYRIEGELYEIDAAVLKNTDRLEGYVADRKDNLYERKLIKVRNEDDEVYEAWMYYQVSAPKNMQKLKRGSFAMFKDAVEKKRRVEAARQLEKQVAAFTDWYTKGADSALVGSYEVVPVENVTEWLLMNKEQIMRLLD